MTFVVLAKWIAQPGQASSVARAIANLVEPSRAEPGCRIYQPHRDLDDRGVFLIYEQYADRAAYEAHCASEHFRRWATQQGIPLLEKRARGFYEPFDKIG